VGSTPTSGTSIKLSGVLPTELADVCYNSIIKLETGGITNPTIETLQKIAKTLEVQVDDLLK
jgi:DNA-binding Xre family transcriptional regulator